MAELEAQIDALKDQVRSIQQKKISGDNIYRLLSAFDSVYESSTEVERKELMRAFIEKSSFSQREEKMVAGFGKSYSTFLCQLKAEKLWSYPWNLKQQPRRWS